MRQTAAMGLSVPFSIGLILADLHILYATKQNENQYHQTRFLGLKYPQNPFAAGALPRTPLGSLQRSPRSTSCIGGEEENG